MLTCAGTQSWDVAEAESRPAPVGVPVRNTPLLCRLKSPIICRDRLGTNTQKTLKYEMRFSQVKHLAAEAHVSGTATFLADIGVPQGTVHAQFVTSARAHANIIALDSTACYEIPVRKRLYCAICIV